MSSRTQRNIRGKRKPRRQYFAFQAYVDREDNRQMIRAAAEKREMSVSQFLVYSALKEASEALQAEAHTKHTHCQKSA